LNLAAVALTAILGFLYWLFSSSARGILELNVLLPMMVTSLYYVWFINGNSFFASLRKTFQQEMVILTTRFVLVGFLVVFTLADIHNLPLFVSLYSLILCGGVAVEILLLFKILEWPHKFPSIRDLKAILAETIWPHLDFLAFNLYPAVLIVISGVFLEKAQIGRISFAIQIINLIFLLSTTAHLRVSTYVANVGFRAKILELKKLFYWTLGLSCIGSILIYFGLHFLVKTPHLASFEGVAGLFAIATLSIPGYLIYQFFNPIWLEMKKIRESAVLNLVNFVIVLILSPLILRVYQEDGGMILFSIFHLGLLAAQMILYLRVTRARVAVGS
jgi:hypothetical protein